jgi:hypothetical protein
MSTIGNGTDWVSESQNTISEGLQKLRNNTDGDITAQDVRDAIYTTYDILNQAIIAASGGSGVSSFTELSDTPANFDGAANYFVKVNSGADGLDFSQISFLNLSNTPSTFSGAANRYVKVNATENGLIFSEESANSFLDLTDTPGSFTPDYYVKVNSAGDGLEFSQISGGGGVTTFLALSDTPGNFLGSGGYYVKVNQSGTALEFSNQVDAGSFLDLTDTPSSYTANRLVSINAGGTGISFIEDTSPNTLLDLTDTPSGYVGANYFLQTNSEADGFILNQSLNLNSGQSVYSGGGSFIPNSSGNAVINNSIGDIKLTTSAGDVIIAGSGGSISFPQISVPSNKALVIQSDGTLTTGELSSAPTYETGNISSAGTNVRILTLNKILNGSINVNAHGVIEITGRSNSASNVTQYAKIFYSSDALASYTSNFRVVLLDSYNVDTEDIFIDGDNGTIGDMSIYFTTKYTNFVYKVVELIDEVDVEFTKTFNMDTTTPSRTRFDSTIVGSNLIKYSNNEISLNTSTSSFITFNENNNTLSFDTITSSLSDYNSPLEVNSTGVISVPTDNFRSSIKKVITPGTLTSNLGNTPIPLISNPDSDRIIRVESVDLYYQHNSATYSGGSTISIQYEDGTSIYDISPDILYNTSYRKNLNLGEKEYFTSNFGENIQIGTVSSLFTNGNGYLHINVIFSSVYYNTNLLESQFSLLGDGYSGPFFFSENNYEVGTSIENVSTGLTTSGNYFIQGESFVYNITDNLIVSTSSFLNTNATFSTGGTVNSGTATGVTLSHISVLNNGIIVSDLTTNTFDDETFIDDTKFYITDSSSTIIDNSTFYGLTSSGGTESSVYIQGTTSVSIGNVVREVPSTEFIPNDLYLYNSTNILDILTGSIIELYTESPLSIIDDLTSVTQSFTFSNITGTPYVGQGNTSSYVKLDGGTISDITSDIVLSAFEGGNVKYLDVDTVTTKYDSYKIALGFDDTTYIGQNIAVGTVPFGDATDTYFTTDLINLNTYISPSNGTGSISTGVMLDTFSDNNEGKNGGILLDGFSISSLDYVDYIHFYGTTPSTYGMYSTSSYLPDASWKLPVFASDGSSFYFQGTSSTSEIPIGRTLYTFTEHTEAPHAELRGEEEGGAQLPEEVTPGDAQSIPRKWKQPIPLLDWIRNEAFVYGRGEEEGEVLLSDKSSLGSNQWVVSINNIRYYMSNDTSNVESTDTFSQSTDDWENNIKEGLGESDPGKYYIGDNTYLFPDGVTVQGNGYVNEEGE